MVVACIPSATLLGVCGHPVTVEVHAGQGLPGFTIVGLPDAGCREARDRVRAAVLSSELPWPNERVTVNLAPADLRKLGSGLDLAMAVGVLVATAKIEPDRVEGLGFLGELGLDGSLRAVPGALPLARAVQAEAVVVPAHSLAEARIGRGEGLRPVSTLAELVRVLREGGPWPEPPPRPEPPPAPPPPDLAEVRGQPLARLALEVAAAGGHHLLMVGPPGAGKTMLAQRLPGLLPPLDAESALDVAAVHSAAGLGARQAELTRPPFRAPHHGASAVALIGGGSSRLRPGEVSLAAKGVLFLDELGEFPAVVLDALRQPLEEGVVRVARAEVRVTMPADFLLVAAMNPCPCGAPNGPVSCRCTEQARRRYARRVSGPLLDRFDLRIAVPRPDVGDLLAGPEGEPTGAVAGRVLEARARAGQRGASSNAALGRRALDRHAPLDGEARRLLEHALRSGRLSARGMRRVHAVARTIADLRGLGDRIDAEVLSVALALRVDPGFDDLRLAG